MIPLFKLERHQLQALDGSKSLFHKLLVKDLEGIAHEELESHLQALERDLLQSSGEFKVYVRKGEYFLNSFGTWTPTYLKCMAWERPLDVFPGEGIEQLEVYENYLTLGNRYLRVLSVRDFPTSLSVFEFSDWGDYVLSFRKVEKLKARQRIDFKRRMHFSSLFKGMRDIDSEHAYKEAEGVLEDVIAGGKALFEVEAFLLVEGSEKKELDFKTDEIVREFRAKDAKLFVEERGLSFFFQTLIPGVRPSFKRCADMPSDYLSFWFPSHQDEIHQQGLELSAYSSKRVMIDIFHPAALSFNVLITGTSGQGKSMLANKLLAQQLEEGCSAVVLDLGNSFRKNVLFHGGQICSERFNPMRFKNPRYLKEFILSGLDGNLSKAQEGRLFEAVKIVMETSPAVSFATLLERVDQDGLGIRDSFAEIMEFFCEDQGTPGQLLYCDFGLYPDAMKAPLIIYLIETFKHLEGRKIFIFDECWHLLQKNASYIAECFRTFRKHNASAVAISQNLDDFSQTQLGRVIIQTSYNKFLFRQALQSSEFIDEHSRETLQGLQSVKGTYSEFLYINELQKKPLRYYSSHLEYELFTSDPNDAVFWQEFMNEKGRYMAYRDAMLNFTSIRHPRFQRGEA